MNILVVGSCTDSSLLAKELNKRLNNSLVVRIDMLKTIKQLILNEAGLRKSNSLGTYIGDVEQFTYDNVPKETKDKIATAFQSIEKGIKEVSPTLSGYAFVASTFDALTNGLPADTYSFIKVYSGLIDDTRLQKIAADDYFISNAIVIKIESPKDSILPITVSEAALKTVEERAFTFIKCKDIEDVFENDVFKLMFESNKDKDTKAEPTAKTVNATPATAVEAAGLQAIVRQMTLRRGFEEFIAEAA